MKSERQRKPHKDPRDMTPEELREHKERVRRSRRKKLELKISKRTKTILFVALMIGFIFMIFVPKSTTSAIEKRTLTEFPTFSFGSYFSGEFTKGVETWYTDTVPFRDGFKKMRSAILQLCGFQTEDTYTLINKDMAEGGNKNAEEDTDGASEETTTEAKKEKETETTLIADSEEEQKNFRAEEAEMEYTDNNILIVNENGHWRGLPLFGGGSHQIFTDSMNYLAQEMGDEINLYCMPVPLSAQFYTPLNAQEYTVDENEYYKEAFASLDSRIKTLNLCDVFTKHTEEDIYLRTDHHWTPLGAYYAARTLAEGAGLPFADNLSSDYEKNVNTGFVGSMYGYTEDARILNDPEDFIYYVPKAPYRTYYYDGDFNYLYEDHYFVDVGGVENSYVMFMGGDTNTVKLKTAVKNGRKLFIMKDSFGNPIPPYLTETFEEIYIADVRYTNYNAIDFMRANGITDFCYICCSYYLADGSAGFFSDCLTQNQGMGIVDTAPEEDVSSSNNTKDETTTQEETQTET